MPVAYHGLPSDGVFNRPIAVQTWWGVTGALTLVGKNQTREFSVDATMTNFATYALFLAAKLTMVSAMQAALYGNLTINGALFNQCLFLGWEPVAPLFFDGSGFHGWTEMGRLKWQQTA